jgi:signal peptidase II
MPRTEQQPHDAPVRGPDQRGPVAESATQPGRRGPEGRPPRRYLLMGIVGAAVLVADQLTKTWALNRLIDGPIDLVGSLRLNLAFNTGTAFSMGSGKGLGPWISVLAIAVVVALALAGGTARTRLGAVAAGLVAGGALGNLGDRAFRGDAGFLHGAVIDFIDLQWWPIFNVADSAIVVGGILLVIVSLFTPVDEPA